MKKTILTLTIMVMAAALIATFSCPAMAKVTGVCSECHTMHNSQGGNDMATGGPNETLLMNSCVGCHTGTNDGTNTTPYVYSTTAPTFGTNTLAGGNFYWVAQGGVANDPKGHNVMGVASQDGNITAAEGAPGSSSGCGSGSCHSSLAVAQTKYSTFGSGCEGCHLNVMHHANDGTGTKYVDEAKGWYRFLAGHAGGGTVTAGYGVTGIEHEKWNYGATVGGINHNEYRGVDDWHATATALAGDLGGTMTGYCCGCHGKFHEQDETRAGASPWLRHPSDAVIPNSGEYATAFGAVAGTGTYDPNVPVARPSTFGGWATGTPSGSVTIATDMVMCLTCHVSHGSPNDDMLRWDCADMIAGDPSKSGGCFVCHTTKND